MFRFELQPPGILYVETSGFWTDDEADHYIMELHSHCTDLRRVQGFALVLVDGRHSAVQSPQVMAKVADIQSILIRDPRDRAAYVVPSSLAKLQAARLSTTKQLEVFTAVDAARAWVLTTHPGRTDD
jgi:hypothetical protein